MGVVSTRANLMPTKNCFIFAVSRYNQHQMEVYRNETREILNRFFEGCIGRAECIDALDYALLAAIPDLSPADLPAVQAILIENSRRMAEIDAKMQDSDINASIYHPEPVLGSR
jgi:hypothetical protein